MTLKVDNLVVYPPEHPTGIGRVMRLNPNGDAFIEWTAPVSKTLPFGAINTEFWSVSDQKMLIVLE